MSKAIKYMFYDLETGGLSAERCSVTEFAYILVDYQLDEIERGRTFIQKYGDLDDMAMQVSGIREEDLTTGITKEEFYKKLAGLFKKHKNKVALAGHNIINFDNKFLLKLFKDFNDDLRDHTLSCHVDTLLLSRIINKSFATHSLGDLCLALDIENTQSHRALADVEATLKLCKKMFSPKETIIKQEEEVRIQI